MSTIQRIGNYAIIDGIERDIVSAIREYYIPSTSDILTPFEIEKAKNTLRHRNQDDIYDLDDHYDLLLGLDLGEKFSALIRHKSKLPEILSDYFMGLIGVMEKLIPIRHDIMHGRPITVDDQILLYAIAKQFRTKPDIWKNVEQVFHLLQEDPDKLKALVGEFIEEENISETLHNLPTVEYNDTGFVRRRDLERQLMRKLNSRNPVVTILGEGGNGKSALILQTAYNLVKANNHDFDAIIWVSAKANRLTTHEIKRIDCAITDSLSLFTSVADEFEPGENSSIDRVYSLLKENKILLIIDNLETILDDKILEFAEDIPGESKLIFTSRLPLGVGVSLTVDGFSDMEALTYFRALTEVYDVRQLIGLKDNLIQSYLDKLHRKPLLIKWFVLGVRAGLSPNSILNSTKLPLDYCMENVLDHLSETAKKVSAALSLLPAGQSPNIIQSVTGLPMEEVEEAFLKLSQFSLISQDHQTGYSNSYTLGLLIQNFLISNSNVPSEFKAKVLTQYRRVVGQYQNERSNGVAVNRFNPKFYVVRSRDESVACQRLREAVKLADENNINAALEIIENQKKVCPQYFEVYRAAAFIHFSCNNIVEAEREYQLAIEADERQPQLHHWYAGFLVRKLNDYQKAELHYKKSHELGGESVILLREWARNKFFIHEYDKAEKLLLKAKELPISRKRDAIILNDLFAQKWFRSASYLSEQGKYNEALSELEKSVEFLSRLNPSDIDRTLLKHSMKALPTARSVQRKLIAPSDIERANEVCSWFEALVIKYDDIIGVLEVPNAMMKHALHSGIHSGRLKLDGVTETYGFMITDSGGEAFLHKSVCPNYWTRLKSGITATFLVEIDRNGRSRVTSLEI